MQSLKEEIRQLEILYELKVIQKDWNGAIKTLQKKQNKELEYIINENICNH